MFIQYIIFIKSQNHAFKSINAKKKHFNLYIFKLLLLKLHIIIFLTIFGKSNLIDHIDF